jgi:K+-sensing histidine kinase KdpD
MRKFDFALLKKLEPRMKIAQDYVLAASLVLGLALLMFAIGRQTLGEAVIALLYLIPISYSAARWGQWPGICAAVVAFLSFNFFFIPPFYTFAVDQMEGWLLLGIFLFVAVIVVGRVQAGLTQAWAHEREALHLYELSTALIGVYTRDAIAQAIATHIQQVFQATLTQVSFLPDQLTEGITVSVPRETGVNAPPDRLIPIFSDAHGLLGEIRLWRSAFSPALSAENEHLLQTIAAQTAVALGRIRLTEVDPHPAWT